MSFSNFSFSKRSSSPSVMKGLSLSLEENESLAAAYRRKMENKVRFLYGVRQGCTRARQYNISVIIVSLLEILENFSFALVFSVNIKTIIVLS